MPLPDPDRPSRWLPGVLLIAVFFALAALSVTLNRQISPATGSLTPAIDTGVWDPAAKARFINAAAIWSSLALGVYATLGACAAVSYRIILRWKVGPAIGWLSLLAVPIVASAAFLMHESPRDTTPSIAALGGQGLFKLDIRVLIYLTNAATILAIASLYCASAMILVRGGSTIDDESDDASLARDLKSLLAVGAIATVVGVLEIGAVHRLPAAATTGSAIDVTGRERLRADLDSLLQHHAPSPDAPDAPFAGLLKLGLSGMLGAEAADALAAELHPSASDTESLRNAVIAAALQARDERLRQENAKALSDVADHAASSCGFIFAIALAAMYVPTALSISRRTGVSGPASLSLTGLPRAGEDELKRKPIADLLMLGLRIVTALSPLLAGIFAELLKHVVALFPDAA